MTADRPSRLVPKLRFPEFQDADEWVPKPLGTFGTFTRGLTYKSSDVAQQGLAVLRASNIQDGRLVFCSDLVHVEKRCSSNLLLQEGDIAICMSNGSKALVGKSAEYKGGYIGDVTVGAFCSIFRASLAFAKIVFKTPRYTEFIAREVSGGNINNLKNSDLEALKFSVPTDEEEQQKIADCLGSLDDLIAAEGRKLEALRLHKTGLMQQLFPRPGETVPGLRFPEFRDAGEWEERKIGELSEVKASGDLDVAYFSNFRSTTHFYPVYSNAIENAGLYGYYSFPKYKSNSVTITARGTLGVAFLRDHEFMGIGRLIVVNDLSNLDPCFLKECWNHLAVIPREVTSIPQLTAVAVRATVLPIPCRAEQQRIAECLSSLDARLSAQLQMLNALKTHKQGLLQQLFPPLESQ